MHRLTQKLPEARQTHRAHQPAPVTLLQICLPSFELSSSTNCLGQLMFNTKWCKSTGTSKYNDGFVTKTMLLGRNDG